MATYTALTTLEGRDTAYALGEAMEERLDPAPTGVGVFEMENGKIKAWRDYFDFATYSRAMG